MKIRQWDTPTSTPESTTPSKESEFQYDGLDRRIKIIEKENGSQVSSKTFIWDGVVIVEERDSSGATVTKRFYDEGVEISGTDYYYTRDHLSSIRELVDNSGTVKARYDYNPYGERSDNEITSGAVEADFGFTGHYYHVASGLCLAPYRAYDPNSGRWLSRDPIGEAGGINLYAYTENNPTTFVDPLGFCSNKAQEVVDAMRAIDDFLASLSIINDTGGFVDFQTFGKGLVSKFMQTGIRKVVKDELKGKAKEIFVPGAKDVASKFSEVAIDGLLPILLKNYEEALKAFEECEGASPSDKNRVERAKQAIERLKRKALRIRGGKGLKDSILRNLLPKGLEPSPGRKK